MKNVARQEDQMSIRIDEYVNVEERLSELGCTAGNGLMMLPTNFDSAGTVEEFLQHSEAATVKSLLRSAGVMLTEIVGNDGRPRYIQNNSADWVGPIIFISSAFWSQNSQAISIALSVISNYLTDFFKGNKTGTAKLDIVIEKMPTRTYKRVIYEGDVAGLSAIENVLRDVADG
jgi:hypothetical protein